MKVTPRQEAVLKWLGRNAAVPESGPEIVARLWHTGAFTSLEQGHRTCKQLATKGLVRPMGWTASNSRTWEITPEGRQRRASLMSTERPTPK